MNDLSLNHFQEDKLALFWQFIHERQEIWQKRILRKEPPPWTSNKILQKQRFTNVYRELDPGTQYVIHNVLERDAPKPDKIFNTMFYRLVGRSETHSALGFLNLTTFDPISVEQQMKYIRDVERKPPFTAAYMVGAYTKMGSHDKVENIVRLFTCIHENFSQLYKQIDECTSAQEVYAVLKSVYGFGNFLSYQVLVDLLYPLAVYGNKPLLPYTHDDWASAGPGAQRGILLLLKPSASFSHVQIMRWLRENQHKEFKRFNIKFPYLRDECQNSVDISLANIQNCLCEFHKYVKISEGTGRGRRKFIAY